MRTILKILVDVVYNIEDRLFYDLLLRTSKIFL